VVLFLSATYDRARFETMKEDYKKLIKMALKEIDEWGKFLIECQKHERQKKRKSR